MSRPCISLHAMKSYYIYTDSGSFAIEATGLAEALAKWGEAPKSVVDVATFEAWLERTGGYGAIQEDGVEIARVRS
jgi:hypothetical protein